MARGKERKKILAGQLLEEELDISLAELCRACGVPADWITELVNEGVLEPRGRRSTHWRFSGTSVQRVQVVLRLQRDLDVNLSGAALALDLMEEIHSLRARLRALEYAGRP